MSQLSCATGHAWAELQKDDSPVKGKVGITTMVAESNQRPAATIGSWGLSLLQGSDHPQSQLKAIKYLTNEQSQRYLFTNFGYTPTQAALFKDAQLTSAYPSLVAIGEALPARPRPQTPLYAQISDVLQRNLSTLYRRDAASCSHEPSPGHHRASAHRCGSHALMTTLLLLLLPSMLFLAGVFALPLVRYLWLSFHADSVMTGLVAIPNDGANWDR